MLADTLEYLECPFCREALTLHGPTLGCANDHSFDIAHQGYVNLMPGPSPTGTADSSAMVEAREAFLAGGHYAPLRDLVAATADRLLAGEAGHRLSGCLVDAGAGTGYYLAAVLDRLPDRVGLALDTSKPALRRAARAHTRIGAVACDVWGRWPVRDECAALVLNIFSPRNAAEFRRVLAPGGAVLTLTPTSRHLQELIPLIGLLNVAADKEQRLSRTMEAGFTCVERRELDAETFLDHPALEVLAAMGPSAYHLERDKARTRVAALPEPLAVTASVALSVYQRL